MTQKASPIVPLPVQVRAILKRGWTQDQLAVAVGMTQAMVSRLANDARHDMSYMIGKKVEAIYLNPKAKQPTVFWRDARALHEARRA